MYQINSSMHNIKTQATLTLQMDQWTNIIAYHHVVLVKLKCVLKRFNIIICLFSLTQNSAFLLEVNRVLPGWDKRSTRYGIWSVPGISPSSPNRFKHSILVLNVYLNHCCLFSPTLSHSAQLYKSVFLVYVVAKS